MRDEPAGNVPSLPSLGNLLLRRVFQAGSMFVVLLGLLWGLEIYNADEQERQQTEILLADYEKRILRDMVLDQISYVQHERREAQADLESHLENQLRWAERFLGTSQQNQDPFPTPGQLAFLRHSSLALDASHFPHLLLFRRDATLLFFPESLEKSVGSGRIREHLPVLLAQLDQSPGDVRLDLPPPPGAPPEQPGSRLLARPLPGSDVVIASLIQLAPWESRLQQRILERLSTVRFGKEGYFFVGTFAGNVLVGPGRGRNMLHVVDVNGLPIVRRLIELAQGGGGFLEYVIPILDGQRTGRKISYVDQVSDWKWYMGTGFLLDDLADTAQSLGSTVHQQMAEHMLHALLILLGLLGFVGYVTFRFSDHLGRKFRLFNQRLESADSQGLDKESQEFLEFAQLTQSVNRLVQARSHLSESLDQARRGADRTSQARADLIGLLGHEVRLPLNAILALTGQLLTPANVNDNERQRQLEDIRFHGETLVRLINNVLDLSRLHSETPPMSFQSFHLHQLLETTLQGLQVTGLERGLAVSLLPVQEDSPPWRVGDPTRLQQVLSHLLENAVKYAIRSKIQVEYRCDPAHPEQVIFSVQETGSLIAPDHPLRRLDTGLTPSQHDLSRPPGLGVSLCSELVARMGGHLDVQYGLETGTHFTFNLPLPPSPSQGAGSVLPHGHPDPSAKRFTGRRLLLVEDDPGTRMLIQSYLKDTGLEIATAGDGETAVSLFAARPFDFVLMDLRLPRQDGLETTRQIRALEVEMNLLPVPILALTIHAQESDRQLCLEAGCHGLVAKPVLPRQLLSILSQYLADPGSTPPALPAKASLSPAPRVPT
ncbi:MAG: cache domain-containing protein [Magnetococcus sp. WYHC-3]